MVAMSIFTGIIASKARLVRIFRLNAISVET
jgi:hypothetical protein